MKGEADVEMTALMMNGATSTIDCDGPRGSSFSGITVPIALSTLGSL